MTNKAFFWPSKKTLVTGPSIFAKRKERTCLDCRLHQHCSSPKMKASGAGKKGILIIGGAPNASDDAQGTQFAGKDGSLLRRELKRHGVRLDQDCVMINAVNCRPPKDRKPKPVEVEACRTRVWSVINKMRPKLILLLGNPAIASFLAHRWKKDLGGITKWRGWCIPDQEAQAWVCAVFHPSYLLEEKTNDVASVLFRRDLKAALKCLKKQFPKRGDDLDYVTILSKKSAILAYLFHLCKHPPEFLAYDLETTGLKPHAKGHQIVSIAFCTSPDKTVAFLYKEEYKPYLQTILSRKGWKIASNIKYELVWSKVKLGCRMRGPFWDTMIFAHCFDNRREITGLKFQAYVQFGIVDYNSLIAPYLKSIDQKNGNSKNRILELLKTKQSTKQLLTYNALDSLYEMWLALKQMKDRRNDYELCKTQT